MYNSSTETTVQTPSLTEDPGLTKCITTQSKTKDMSMGKGLAWNGRGEHQQEWKGDKGGCL